MYYREATTATRLWEMSVTLAGGGNGGDGIRGDIYIHLQAENAVAYYIATRPIFDL